jgi:hypothetical protein
VKPEDLALLHAAARLAAHAPEHMNAKPLAERLRELAKRMEKLLPTGGNP